MPTSLAPELTQVTMDPFALALMDCTLAATTLHRCVPDFGSPEAIWQSSSHRLSAYLNESQLKRFLDYRAKTDVNALVDQYQKADVQLVLASDPFYPALLKTIHNPPWGLFVKGSLTALTHSKLIAIVGTRRASHYGRQAVDHLVNGLTSYSPCIISGLALGVDTYAHKAALTHNLPTVAVLGTGFHQLYPKSNAPLVKAIIDAGGAVVSEYPLNFNGDKFTFPQRNRIVAGISQGVLVVEAPQSSGALITASLALEENRAVMAVPGSIFSDLSSGPLSLIYQGATPVVSGESIAQVLGWHPDSPLASTQLSLAIAEPSMPQGMDEYSQLIWVMLSEDPVSFDQLYVQLKDRLTTAELSTTITMMELQGWAVAHPGNLFTRR